MNEQWTADVVGTMHRYRIKNTELAKACGYSHAYISQVLNCGKKFSSSESAEKTKEKILSSLDALVAVKEGEINEDRS